MSRLFPLAVAIAALVGCANDQTGHSKEELARSAYQKCLESAASVLRDGPLQSSRFAIKLFFDANASGRRLPKP